MTHSSEHRLDGASADCDSRRTARREDPLRPRVAVLSGRRATD